MSLNMKTKKAVILVILVVLVIFGISISSAVEAEPGNNDPMLKNLEVSGYSLDPSFDMFTTEYVIAVDESVNQINVIATPDDSNATVQITGNTNLQNGRNEVKIDVTAENGQNKETYYIYVTKGSTGSTNANLKELTIKDCELAPNFSADITDYAFEFPKNLDKVEINAVPEDSNATVEIVGNENLTEITQQIQVKVTAADGQTVKTYNLTAKKSGEEVESPEGTEPGNMTENGVENSVVNETVVGDAENQQSTNNVILYVVLVVILIIIIAVIVKYVIERRKEKNEK